MSISTSAAMSGLEALLAGMELPAEGGNAVIIETNEPPQSAAEVAVAASEKPKRKSRAKPKPVEQTAAQEEPKPEPGEEPADEPQEPANAAGEPEGAAQDAKPADEPKSAPEKRIYWGANKLGRLQHKLGADLDKFFIIRAEDAELEGPELSAKIAENKTMFRGLAKKVQNRATGIIELVSGKTSRVNPVVEHALRLLARDRVITTGDAGNLHQRLIGGGAGYTPDAARAMGNSTMGALKALGIVKPGTEKQQYVPDDSSVFLALVSEKMGLPFADIDELCDAEDAAETLRLEALRTPVRVETNHEEQAAPDKDDEGGLPGSALVDDLLSGIIAAASQSQMQPALI